MGYYSTKSFFIVDNPDKMYKRLKGMLTLKARFAGVDYDALKCASDLWDALFACGLHYRESSGELCIESESDTPVFAPLFARIAPFVRDGSFVEVVGDNGVKRYYFEEGKVRILTPTWMTQSHPLLPKDVADKYRWWMRSSKNAVSRGVSEHETKNMLASLMVWLYERLAAYKLDAPDTVRLNALEILYGGRTYLEDEMIEEVMERVGEWLRGEQTDAQADEILRMFTALVPNLWH